jgi:hypothetical protein
MNEPATYITRDEFGVNLFECVRIIAGIQAIDKHRADAIHRGKPQEGLLDRRKKLQVTLAALLPTLTNQEMDQVLDKYPWVTSC